MLRALRLPALLAVVIAAGCSNPNALLNASISNVLDTALTLWSLEKGPLDKPTAYSLNASNAVRTWEVGTSFEFILSIDSANRAYFIPLAGLGLAGGSTVKPGLLRTTALFDSMTKAPQNGYLTVDTLLLTEGDRFFVRTGVNTCSLLGVPLYAKLEVTDIDTAAATVTIKVLSDQNCGYRGLSPGIPRS